MPTLRLYFPPYVLLAIIIVMLSNSSPAVRYSGKDADFTSVTTGAGGDLTAYKKRDNSNGPTADWNMGLFGLTELGNSSVGNGVATKSFTVLKGNLAAISGYIIGLRDIISSATLRGLALSAATSATIGMNLKVANSTGYTSASATKMQIHRLTGTAGQTMFILSRLYDSNIFSVDSTGNVTADATGNFATGLNTPGASKSGNLQPYTSTNDLIFRSGTTPSKFSFQDGSLNKVTTGTQAGAWQMKSLSLPDSGTSGSNIITAHANVNFTSTTSESVKLTVVRETYNIMVNATGGAASETEQFTLAFLAPYTLGKQANLVRLYITYRNSSSTMKIDSTQIVKKRLESDSAVVVQTNTTDLANIGVWREQVITSPIALDPYAEYYIRLTIAATAGAASTDWTAIRGMTLELAN